MIVRMKTSRESKERMEALNRVLKFSSNAILLRYALALSINYEIDIYNDKLAEVSNNSGFEINRVTLFGENELAYKLMMGVTNSDDDEVFFPHLTNMHIERGLILLEREYKIAGNKEKLINNLINRL